MDSLVSTLGGRGPWGSQDETSPFPLEFMVARPLGSHSQDETSPFPLDFVVVARKRRANQDETSPFPLEYQVTLPESEPSAAPRGRLEAPKQVVRVERTRGGPRRARHESSSVEASAELRAYAARIAAGEELPPFRGPVVENEARPGTPAAAPNDTRPVPSAARPVANAVRRVEDETPFVSSRAMSSRAMSSSAVSSRAVAKLALGLALMTAALVAAAVGGDDASLRALGSSIGGWFSGNDASFERLPLESATSPCNERVNLRAAAARR